LDAESVAGHLLKAGSVFAFLAANRQELFPDEMFGDLFPSGRGRPSVPADVMAAVITLPALHGLSDSETVDAVTFDLRWKAACGLPVTAGAFHATTLTYWRRRLAASDRPNRILMPSADLDGAVSTAVTARVHNNGQSCISAKRFIIHTDIYDAFLDRFVQQMQALRVGDPTDPDTDVGPLATEAGRDEVEKQVDDAAAAGAVVRCGGKRFGGPGWFYPPTVITDITRDMALFTEEVFGPVASVDRVADIDEAIEIANATTFGPGSSAWTRNQSEQQRFIDEIDAGQVFINGMTVSYNELPFGGIKRAGYGRELSAHGIREFCNIKTIWVG
jgi:hypothetical protein